MSSTPSGAGLPRGESHVWAEGHAYRFGPFGETVTEEVMLIHLDGQAYPVNRGQWSWWMETSSDGADVRLGAEDIPLRWGRLGFDAGDFTLLRGLENDPWRREFRQNAALRGGQIALHTERSAFRLRAGTLTERRGFLGSGNVPTGTQVVGGAVSVAVRGPVRVVLGWDRQSPGRDGSAGFSLPSVSVESLPANGFSWLLEGRASRADDLPRWPASALAGARWQGSRWDLGVNARRVEPGFQGLGLYRDPHSNATGWRVFGGGRPLARVTAGGSLDWSQDLEPNSPRNPRERRVVSHAFVNAGLAGPFYVTASLSYRDRSDLDPDSLLVDQGVFSGRGELGVRLRRTLASVSYTRGLQRDPTPGGQDWHEDQASVRATQWLAERFTVELNARYTERRLPNGAWTSRERGVTARFNWEPRSGRLVWFALGREEQVAAESAFDRDQWQVGAGFEQPLPEDFAFRVDVNAFLRAGEVEAENTRVGVRLSKRFSFGGGALRDLESLPEYGTVHGAVFEDLNGDGDRDPGEPGVSGQLVLLGSGAQAVTGTDGMFVLDRATIGAEYVSFETTRLPTEYLAPPGTSHRLELRPGEVVRLDFPVMRAAAIGGRVLAVNAAGASSGVPDVLVRVVGSHHDAFTDSEGRFVMRGLSAGMVELEIVRWSLPDKMRLQGESVRAVVLTPGDAVLVDPFVLEGVAAGTPVKKFKFN